MATATDRTAIDSDGLRITNWLPPSTDNIDFAHREINRNLHRGTVCRMVSGPRGIAIYRLPPQTTTRHPTRDTRHPTPGAANPSPCARPPRTCRVPMRRRRPNG